MTAAAISTPRREQLANLKPGSAVVGIVAAILVHVLVGSFVLRAGAHEGNVVRALQNVQQQQEEERRQREHLEREREERRKLQQMREEEEERRKKEMFLSSEQQFSFPLEDTPATLSSLPPFTEQQHLHDFHTEKNSLIFKREGKPGFHVGY